MTGPGLPADRLSGAVVVLFGAALYGLIVPWQVETVDYGWLRPRTLPRILAVILILAGLWQILRPAADARPGAAPWIRASLFAAVLAIGLAGIARLGFVVVAPAMALAIMLLAGERRPVWLILGVAGAPAAIWLVVEVLLGRPLP